MKLNVFLITQDEIDDPELIPKINIHYEWILITKGAIETSEQLSILLRKYRPMVICSVGDIGVHSLQQLPAEWKKKWIHFSNLIDIKSEYIENCYINAITNTQRENDKPLYSVISTTFHSGDKIFRPFHSLKAQTYNNWEWVIWDDSKEDHQDVWNQLLEFQQNDIRIHCYRAPQHSGFIGEMKWRSASLCKGDWIVELDHDDILNERLFEWCNQAISKHPDADFICTNCIELYEKSEDPFLYGDYYGFGQASYQKEWIRGKWHNVSVAPQLNDMTIRHIIGVPNHVRIWKRSFYEKIGRHNTDLPVVDDYELLLRSFLEGKWIYINACGYYQYRNQDGNNFTFLRNSLIQYLTHRMRQRYELDIQAALIKYGVEDITKNNNIVSYKAWEYENYKYIEGLYYKFMPDIIPEKCVSIVMTVNDEPIELIKKSVETIVQQEYKDWILYIVGNKSSTLNEAMDLVRASYDDSIIHKIKWWNLSDRTSHQNNINYAHRMLICTDLITYIQPGSSWYTKYLVDGTLRIGTNEIWILNLENESEYIYNCIHKYNLLKKYNYINNDVIVKFIKESLSKIDSQ